MTDQVTRISDTLREMAQGLVRLYPGGIPAADVPNLASALLMHADNVGKVEHMLERKMKAETFPTARRGSARQPWALLPATPPAAADPSKVVQFRPRGQTLPVEVPVEGGVA